jgi:hypothetical protein
LLQTCRLHLRVVAGLRRALLACRAHTLFHRFSFLKLRWTIVESTLKRNDFSPLKRQRRAYSREKNAQGVGVRINRYPGGSCTTHQRVVEHRPGWLRLTTKPSTPFLRRPSP